VSVRWAVRVKSGRDGRFAEVGTSACVAGRIRVRAGDGSVSTGSALLTIAAAKRLRRALAAAIREMEAEVPR